MEGLVDRTSAPAFSPTAKSDELVDLVLRLRVTSKYGADRISALLKKQGWDISTATVDRILRRNGMSRLKDLDRPTGEKMRVIRYEHEGPGDMIHVDIKKLGRIPEGGGWRVHGQGSDEHRKSKRKPNTRPGYIYVHSAVDDFSRLAYSEILPNEKAETAAGFWMRAVAFFTLHGITVDRVLTDNGACYRSRVWAKALIETGCRHKRTRPYTPKTNGKVERFNGTLANEWAYVRPYSSDEERAAALVDFLNSYNNERDHSALGHKPPATRVPKPGYRLVLGQPIEAADPAEVQLMLHLEGPTS